MKGKPLGDAKALKIQKSPAILKPAFKFLDVSTGGVA
jgi:hypothetical protein